MSRFTFPKKLRLLNSINFNCVFKNNPKINRRWHIITILGILNILGYPRIGLIISKKYVKRSHERNRIKRIIRETFRLYQHVLLPMDFIFIAKKSIIDLDNTELTNVLKKLCHRYFQ